MAQLSCPKCNGLAELGGYAPWQWIVAICFFPIGLLAFLAGRQPSVCRGCGYSWTGSSPVPHLVVERREIHSQGYAPPPPPMPTAAPSKDVYAELLKLDELKTKGILSEAEFEAQKKKLLA